MTTVESRPPAAQPDPAPSPVLRTVEEALEHVEAICFKTGPPARIGTELEWIVHHAEDPGRDLDSAALRAALGDHAPPTLIPDSPHRPLPHGGRVTLEPGGQIEISTPAHDSLGRLHRATTADIDHLTDRLRRHGLRLSGHGIDPYRPARRLLRTPRYDAMASAFRRRGPAGHTAMCATAATQVCLDAGEPDQVAARWHTLHTLGPVLLALFATSRRHAGRDSGCASARLRAWLDADPGRTAPVPAPAGADPAAAWARYALAAPLLCVRRRDGRAWHAPPGVTFADWVTGAIRPAPTVDDLTYHLGTLFPVVRPRGYLEVRYVDAQPPGEWLAPVALLAVLLADRATTAAAAELSARAAGRWRAAARDGLADPVLRSAAAAVAELGGRALAGTDLTPAARQVVVDVVSRRLAGGEERP